MENSCNYELSKFYPKGNLCKLYYTHRFIHLSKDVVYHVNLIYFSVLYDFPRLDEDLLMSTCHIHLN